MKCGKVVEVVTAQAVVVILAVVIAVEVGMVLVVSMVDVERLVAAAVEVFTSEAPGSNETP